MADLKITELNAATTLVDADLLTAVTDVATTAVNKKITWTNAQGAMTKVGKVTVTQPASGSTLTVADGTELHVEATTHVNQDLTSDATPTFAGVNATTFDTNVAAAAVTLAGTTLAADGTDAAIDINITPKGTGEVNLPKVDIDAGTIDGVTIGASAAPTVTNLGSVATCDINGGTIDGVTIGGASAGAITGTTINGTTFDTNVAAAGVTLAGTTLSADGSDSDISITITPKGTGSVVLSKVDINAGSIDGVTIGASVAPTVTNLGTVTTCDINGGTIDGTTIATSDITVGSAKTLNVSAGTLTLASGQIKATSLQNAAEDLGAADVNVNLGNTNGSFNTNLTIDGTLQAGSVGVTGTRIANGFFADLAVTNAISGSITGNAATVTTNANLTGVVTSTGNATAIASGAIKANMLQSAAADLGAADVTINLGNTNGSFVTNVTTDGSVTSGTALATTFDTNVVAAGVTLAGTTLSADGTDSDISISVTPKGTGSVVMSKVDIGAGEIDGATIGANSAGAITGTTITANTGIVPDANDGAYLGQAGTAFSDLFLAEGGVINWDSGDLTLTQTGNSLDVAGGTFTAAIKPRVVTTTDDATAVIDIDVTDVYQLSAVSNATEFTLTGTAYDGQKLMVRIKDAGAAKGLTWTGFTAIGITLPTTTVASKWTYVGCVYNSAASAWHAIATTTEA